MPVDAQAAIAHTLTHDSDHPVTTARYMIEVVMNENEPYCTEQEHKERLARALQDVLDGEGDGALIELRYDLFLFDVLTREVLDEAGPKPQEDE